MCGDVGYTVIDVCVMAVVEWQINLLLLLLLLLPLLLLLSVVCSMMMKSNWLEVVIIFFLIFAVCQIQKTKWHFKAS